MTFLFCSQRMIYDLVKYQLAFGSLLYASACKLELPSIIACSYLLCFRSSHLLATCIQLTDRIASGTSSAFCVYTLLRCGTFLMLMWLWGFPSISEDYTRLVLNTLPCLISCRIFQGLGVRVNDINLPLASLHWPEGLFLCAQDLRAGFWSCTGRLQLWCAGHLP